MKNILSRSMTINVMMVTKASLKKQVLNYCYNFIAIYSK